MYFLKLLFLISMLNYSKCAIERDLLLTPKENLQVLGRTLFYNPSNYETNGTVPWEETLKHVTFLTLFTEAGSRTNLSELQEYRDIMHAPYIKAHEEYPRFGDIITMARGWVEKAEGYSFNEGLCEEVCFDNALAIWRVQKIRHRDPLRGFRFEMKFSITPLDNEGLQKNKAHNINEQFIKSFILKDDEYPMNFNQHSTHRRSDSFENFSNERQARIVNHDSRQDLTNVPQLNIGEFFRQVPKASSKVGYLSGSRNDLPTTYRPHYQVRFTKPVYEAPEEQEEPKPVVTHHFHHHYFMNDAETSTLREEKVYHGNPEAIRIIEPPNVGYLPNRYVLTTTTGAPPAQPVFYLPPHPLYLKQSFPHAQTTKAPFRKSEQHFEEMRYSEPDPLYQNLDELNKEENSNDNMRSDEISSVENHPQVERPGTEVQNTLIEQLPQSAEDQGTHVPFLEEKPETTTTIKPTTILYQSTRRTLLPKNKFFVTPPSTSPSQSPSPSATTRTPTTTPTPLSDNLIRHVTRSSPKNRNYIRSTTEQPILKWKPKRKPKQSQLPTTTDSSVFETTTEEKIVTVTPSKVEDFEVLTQKSVSKSISVKVGNRSKEIPLIVETTTTFIEDDEPGTSDIDDNDDANEDE